MLMKAPWLIPGPPSALARRSAKTFTCPGHYAEAFFLEACFIVVGEFHWNFIEVAAFRTIDN
jgi:hypothetical protein